MNCFYCGVPTTTVRKKTGPLPDNFRTQDHILPKSRGGKWIRGNTVTACDKCNREKGCLSYEEYRVVVGYRKRLVDIADTKIFAGETILPDRVRSLIPLTIRNQVRTAIKSSIAIAAVFLLTKLVPSVTII